MKHIPLTTIFILSSLVVQAEQSYHLSGTLNSGQDYHYTANSHITLASGFSSEPSNGHEVILDIDSYAVFPPNTGVYGGPFPNNNGVVGSIGGQVDVSRLGGAVYDIPIELPEGLGGIKPQLSISYNSQGRNGLLGWGWDLNGISSIIRTGGNMYYDGYISTGDYTRDRFCLDGKRLLKVSTGNYGANGTSYRTNLDQMNKIVSYSESGINGPSYFKIWTADGKILYYGNSSDSKALMSNQNHVNIWLLKKIEDRYGNTMEYQYTILSDTYRLNKITYSGNSNDNISPAFSVEFHYSNRDDIEIIQIGNSFFQQKYLLDEICIKNGEAEMYKYSLTYQTPDPQNGYPYHLLTEILLSASQEHLNPTKILWGSNNHHATSSADLKLNITTNGIDNAFMDAVKFSGDLNGDGWDDVVSAQYDGSGQYTTVDVFINKGVDGNLVFDYLRSFSPSQHISWIQLADFNGDGRDDILFSNRVRRNPPFPDQIDGTVYLSKIGVSGNLYFTTYQLPICLVPHELAENHLIGDFFGDGKNSILIQSATNDKKTGLESSLLFTFDATENRFQEYDIVETLGADRCFAADYNGDGITEILYKKSDGTTSLAQLSESNGQYQYSEIYNGNPINWDDCFPGDYNGDGLIDALFYKSSDANPWRIHLSSNTGFSKTNYALPQSFPYESPGNYLYSLDRPKHTTHYIKVADFDGNGCADIALFKDYLFYVFYGPMRSSGDNAPFAYTHRISTQNFNLYDNMNVCLGNFLGKENTAYLGNSTVSILPVMTTRHEVKKITDGLGRETEFSYDYLMPNPNNPSEDDFYQLLSNSANPNNGIYSAPLPIRALKSVTTYNINNKPLETRCFYKGALLHKHGKGFLGFSKTRQDDYCNHQLQKRTIRQYDIERTNSIVHMMMTEEDVFDKNERLMAKSTYANYIYTHLRNDKVFIPWTDKTLEEYDVTNPDRLIKKEIQETTLFTHCNQIHKYNDILSITSQSKGITCNPNNLMASSCEFQEIHNTSYAPDNLNTWLINRPATTTSIAHREGDYDDICVHKIFTYDDKKAYQIKSVTEIPNDGSNPYDRLTKKTDYQYDPTGNVIMQTVSTPHDNQAPRWEAFEYGRNHGCRLLTKHTNALNQSTVYSYDSVYNYCKSITDCNGLMTRCEQDPFGITQTTIHPDGTISCKAIRWTGNSFYQWEKKTGQATRATYYSITGEIIQSQNYDINGELLYADFQYDDFGRIIKKTPPHKLSEETHFLQYEYDDHNQVTRITHADGSYETIQYDGYQKSTTFHALDGSSQSESKTTNVMGWVTRSTDAEGSSVVYEYNALGKPLSFQIEGHDETRIDIAYDALGNRISLNDPDYGLTTCEYNAFNDLTKYVSPKMDETDYYYDVLGNAIRRIETDKKRNRSQTTEWQYGQENGLYGLLTRIVSDNQIIDYQYDELLRVEKTTEIRGENEYQTIYTYDNASRVESITYPTNYTINYHYTSEGYLQSISDTESNTLWKTIETNNMVQPTKYVTGNGFVTCHEHDPYTNRLLAIRTTMGNETIQNYRYEYDDYSNMTCRSDLRNASTEQFTYDALNRLTSTTDINGTSSYSYDLLGRMTSKTGPSGTVFSDADYSLPRPHAIKSVQSTRGTFPQERMDLIFNSFNKVETITEGTKQVSFDYGYDHQRIRTTENIDGVIRNKVYVNNCEFITQQGHNPITRTFISGPCGVFAVAETIYGKTKLHYIHKDHLSSWTTISDSDGNIEQENHFDAWGGCQNPDNLMFDRGFTGHEHIKGMNLINMNGRLYDPLTSTMLNPDNNIQMPDFTQNLNRYSYCLNNPLTYSDPDGNVCIEAILNFYLLYCTDMGYEIQKYISPVAFHIDLHLSTQQIGIGFDVSVGLLKELPVSARIHCGLTYYWYFYDNSYCGMEYRAGAELCLGGLIAYSGTTFQYGDKGQTTNAIIVGNRYWQVTYENDYMFHIGDRILKDFAADGGDRYRSAAAKIRIGVFSLGVNLFTGDPGLASKSRRTEFDQNGRATYVRGKNGEDPDEYRAGVFYIGYGPVKVGANSEQIRNLFQNRFAHDFLCKGESPYFKVLDRPAQAYFYFGSGTGDTLW